MLNLLLDEQISPKVAAHVALHRTGLIETSLHEWHDGNYIAAADDRILRLAFVEKLTLVTYELRTIPALLTSFAEEGVSHGGVVLICQQHNSIK